MALDPKQEVRRLLDMMTATVNAPEMSLEARREAIRDFSTQLTTQTKTPALTLPEPPKQKWVGNLMVL